MSGVLGRVLPVVAVVCWLAVVAGAVLAVATHSSLVGPLFAVPGFGTVGVILAVRRPTNPIGWLLMAMASVPLLSVTFGLPPETQNGLVVAALAVALVLFPTGRPPGRVWLVPMALVVASWLSLGRLGVVTMSDDFQLPVGVVVAALSLIVCALAPIMRFRRAGGLERSQLRWLGAAAGMTAFAVLVTGVGLATGIDALTSFGGGAASVGFALGLPGAILVAILRYRLYDIDRIVSRTVTYVVVAAFVALVYAVPVVLAPQVLGSSNDLVTAAATLGAAVAFSPLRLRVRNAVDLRFNRSAYHAAREVEHLALGLRDRVDQDAIANQVTAVVQRALQPQRISVWFRSAD